ncbi:MAG: hypothetical protein KIT83_11510 [Bryobacterales bacterium]|nr:hypothetical protein [Bryobacterales bacterium]
MSAGSLVAADAAHTGTGGVSKDHLVSELSMLRKQATQVANIAKNKRSSASDVRFQVEAIHESTRKIREMVQANPDYFGPTGSERRNFVESTATVMEVLATNKMNLLEQYSEGRTRDMVRGHASGIADRVARLERTLSSPRS